MWIYDQTYYFLYFNYSPPGLPTKLARAHDPPFGPKNRADHAQILGPRSQAHEHSCPIHKPPRLEPSFTRQKGFLAVWRLTRQFPQRVGEARYTKRFWDDISPHLIQSAHVTSSSKMGKHCRLAFPYSNKSTLKTSLYLTVSVFKNL